MGSLFRRGRVWWVKFSYRGRIIRRSLATDRYNEARRKKTEIERGLDEGRYLEPSKTPLVPVLAEFLAIISAVCAHRSRP